MAVITGAGSGIGRAIAHQFAANGASVCLLDINRTHAETVAAEITRTGGTASAYECDVSDSFNWIDIPDNFAAGSGSHPCK